MIAGDRLHALTLPVEQVGRHGVGSRERAELATDHPQRPREILADKARIGEHVIDLE